jgi:hypothetical protein
MRWMPISMNMRMPAEALASAMILSDRAREGDTHTARLVEVILFSALCAAMTANRGRRCWRKRIREKAGRPATSAVRRERTTSNRTSRSSSSLSAFSGSGLTATNDCI